MGKVAFLNALDSGDSIKSVRFLDLILRHTCCCPNRIYNYNSWFSEAINSRTEEIASAPEQLSKKIKSQPGLRETGLG
jgi:hypothetical protein